MGGKSNKDGTKKLRRRKKTQKKKKNMNKNARLGGATVFPTDDNASINSLHHPWACSLRRSGFRGRHRCGVTLLSGK